MKLQKIFAILLCLTLVITALSSTFGVYAQGAKDAPATENTENGDEKTDSEKKESFFEAFASMFKEFHPKGFVEQLGVMGIGMLGIFIIIGVIIIATVVINKVFSRAPHKENQ